MPPLTTFFAMLALVLSASAIRMGSNFSLALTGACTPGALICSGNGTQFFICDPPKPPEWQAVAAGTTCFNGKMVSSASPAMQTVPGTAYSASASSATLPPVSITLTITSFATVMITATPSTSLPAASSPPTNSTTTSSAQPTFPTASPGHPVVYTGDGSTWPQMSAWLPSFEDLWALNEPTILISCQQYNQSNPSAEETANLKSAIQTIGAAAGVDTRFVLAIVMQESKGCVRVPSTYYSVVNPGLMQTFGASGSCFPTLGPGGVHLSGVVAQDPCGPDSINEMIRQGVDGVQGVGLAPLHQKVGGTDAASYYRTARVYNSGSIPADGDLGGAGSTASYASDIANRLQGVEPGSSS